MPDATLIQRLNDEADLCRNEGAADIASLLDEARAAIEEAVKLPKDPPPGLLMSMALRYDHALGCPGYYDEVNRLGGSLGFSTGASHSQRLESTLRQMRQLYEEVSGHGFYRPEREAEYVAMLTAAAPPADAASKRGE
jgi:hypothetical protein